MSCVDVFNIWQIKRVKQTTWHVWLLHCSHLYRRDVARLVSRSFLVSWCSFYFPFAFLFSASCIRGCPGFWTAPSCQCLGGRQTHFGPGCQASIKHAERQDWDRDTFVWKTMQCVLWPEWILLSFHGEMSETECVKSIGVGVAVCLCVCVCVLDVFCFFQQWGLLLVRNITQKTVSLESCNTAPRQTRNPETLSTERALRSVSNSASLINTTPALMLASSSVPFTCFCWSDPVYKEALQPEKCLMVQRVW